jgi:peptide/nickel transport system permease protein
MAISEPAAESHADLIASELAEQTVAGTRGRSPLTWLAWRIVQGLVVLLAVSVLIFALTEALPGDPVRTILGKNASPAAVAAVRHTLGLDKPVTEQYVHWLGNLVTGHLGTSLVSAAYSATGAGQSVASLVLPRLVNSLTLLVLAAVISLPLAVFLGAVSAVKRDRTFDRAGLVVSLLFTAVPEFVVGILLVVLFASTVWKILPAVAIVPTGSTAIANPKELVLPVLTLVLVVVPYPYRLARAGMIDALQSEYVTMARLKGVPARRVVRKHALPNAIIPVVQASGIVLTYLLGGVVLVEFVFGFPGLGTLLTTSVDARDLPTVQACALIYAAGVVIINIAVDGLTILATPRVRTSEFR